MLVGCCYIDPITGECMLAEFQDSSSYAKLLYRLAVYEAIEIIIPKSSRGSRLSHQIQKSIPASTVHLADSKLFDTVVGRDQLAFYASDQEGAALATSLTGKGTSLACFAALIQCLKDMQRIDFIAHSLKIGVEKSAGILNLDISVLRDLELLKTCENGSTTPSLFALLNRTSTAMGSRYLRIAIIQPLIEEESLNERLDAIDELAGSVCTNELQASLRSLPDLDRKLTSLFSKASAESARYVEQRLRDLLALKGAVFSLQSIAAKVSCYSSALLMRIATRLNDTSMSEISTILLSVLADRTVPSGNHLGSRHLHCYAVNPGINSMLDIARQAYTEAIDDSVSLASSYGQDFCLPITLQFEKGKGLYLSVEDGALTANLPQLFINVMSKKKKLHFTTLALRKQNTRIDEALNEVLTLSNSVVRSLIERLRPHLEKLYLIADAIGLLDMIVSLTRISTSRSYTRPQYGSALVIKNGRHPLKEADKQLNYVPNDTYCDASTKFQLISGAPMSGKSSYLRQVGLIVILGLIGCYVPADYASIRIVDHLYTRICNDDGIDLSGSAFSLEMQETASVLQRLSPNSLCIVDGLCRGTSLADGFAITLSIAEFLARTSSFVLFSTHFGEIQNVLRDRTGVVSFHLSASHDATSGAITQEHRVIQGRDVPEDVDHQLAGATLLPRSFLDRAVEVEAMLKRSPGNRMNSMVSESLQQSNPALELRVSLQRFLKAGQLEGQALKSWLSDLLHTFRTDTCND